MPGEDVIRRQFDLDIGLHANVVQDLALAGIDTQRGDLDRRAVTEWEDDTSRHGSRARRSDDTRDTIFLNGRGEDLAHRGGSLVHEDDERR
jgi:hypothetical protein